MLNLDTHILLHLLSGQLRAAERLLLAGDRDWGISAIVLWELEKLRQKGRITRGADDPRVRALLDRMTIWPNSIQVCLSLRALDFNSDPADELIAATSVAHDVPLITRDARIRASKVVRFA